MDVKLQNTPDNIQKFGLFCLWKYEERSGRKTKVPYNPRTLERGDSTDKSAFVSFPEIVNIWQREQDHFDGVGIGVFDQLAAVDIDHCIDPEDGLSELARNIVSRLNSYTEISPSGEGIRIFFGVLDTEWYDKSKYYINNRNRGLEIYLPGTTNRFLTFTGNTTNKRPVMMCEREIKAILDDYMLRQPKEQSRPQLPAAPADLSDRELIDKAAAASNGDLFRKLWSGDISGYPSHSEADQALCNILAFWTGCNEARIDTLFRQSGLMRDKWNRKQSGTTYGAITAGKAAADCRAVYDPVSGDPLRDFAREVKSTEPRGDPEKPLPEVVSFEKVSGDIPPLKPEIIKGILREGHKMLLAGQSKAGKSFDLIELALCFASGGSWHGFQCEKTKVLYVNMEIDAASFFHRVNSIAEKMQLPVDAIGDRLKIWNLRGQGAGIASLVEPLKKVSAGCGAVIIDPIYKVMEGDENNASEMAAFTKNLDKVAEGGAAVIFAHHFGKNTQGVYKDPMNRASGSGVFARDPDAIITMSSLEEISVTPEIRESAGVSGTASCFQLDFTLREFPPVRPLKIWFDYPIHIIDNGSLSGVCVNGAQKTVDERRAVKIAVLAKAFANYADQIEDDGGISLKFLDHRVEQIGGKGRTAGEKTIRAYAETSGGEFYCLNGKLYKHDKPEEYNPFEDEEREIPRNS